MAAGFDPIEDVVAAIARGEIVVLVDDEDRENEGDLIMAAEFATPEKIAFFVRHTSGVIVAPLTEERCDELRLPLMVEHNTESHRTAFTISVDFIEGTTTGISASDRAATLRGLADPKVRHTDFARPGHIFPLRAKEGGVLKRAGHTEAGVDLARMAGLNPAALICEIVNDDGSMARLPDLRKFCATHRLLLSSIEELVKYRRRTELLIDRVGSADAATRWGNFTSIAYRSAVDGTEHLAFVLGDVANGDPVLTRVHSECLSGDAFGVARCDCGLQLSAAMEQISSAGRGVLVYLRGTDGFGTGLSHGLRSYSAVGAAPDATTTSVAGPSDTAPKDSREYGIGAQILADLGIRELLLMTNNPAKYGGLAGYGLRIVERVAIEIAATAANADHLRAKERMGHHIAVPTEIEGSPASKT
jgi:3,4-dihydroxy 2-butanone 4-phosphate synthase / GTP cyclohydrolase II